MMKRITLLLAVILIVQSLAGAAVGADDGAAEFQYYSDEACTEQIGDISAVSAGTTVYYKAVAPEGFVLDRLGVGGVSEVTDLSFVVSDAAEFAVIPSYVVAGDFDGSGTCDVLDAIWMARFVVGWKADAELWTVTESERAGDTDGNGIINILDAIAIVNSITGLGELDFPAEQSGFETYIASEVDRINAEIAALGEITDTASAAEVSRILEDYSALPLEEQKKIEDIQKIREAVKTSAEVLGNEDLTLKVMSFNVRYNELTEDRIDRVVQTIKNESPDIVGLQEGMDPMCERIVEVLGDEYEMLGHGRDEGKVGENCNVLYRKSKFNLIESKTLWYSEDPEIWHRIPSAACARIFTYQLLERKSDGQVFLHVNTHLDHANVEPRLIQADMLISYIEEYFGKQYPVILTGDFNCKEESKEFKKFIRAGYEETNNYGESTRTYQGYGAGSSIIDFCFVNEYIPVVSYKVCDEQIDGEWVSDHNAIVSEVIIYPSYESFN